MRSRTNRNADRTITVVVTAILAVHWAAASIGAQIDQDAFQTVYAKEIRPLIVRYCADCHSGEDAEAQIDLTTFQGWDDVRKQPGVWLKVRAMLQTEQMPPEDAELHLTSDQRARLLKWVLTYLTWEAKARAGDPGRVVLRRLSNAQYTYTLRDLTGVDALEPAREFPIDGAAGEGFTNTGSALVMSPALFPKYLDAARGVADHAVLLPDGMRFSPRTTPRDWTDEMLAEIREFYREFTNAGGGEQVNLQGVVFDTNEGGLLPVEKYLAATLAERDALAQGRKTIEAAAAEHGLNAKYLGTLWDRLTADDASFLLDRVRARWRDAKPGDAAALAGEIAAWQNALWKFNTVGQIGRPGAPKQWLEPVTPLVARQELRLKIPAANDGDAVTLSLVAGDVGDGNEQDFVVWEQPRLVAPGRKDLLLRDVLSMSRDYAARREKLFAATARFLAAADEAATANGPIDLAKLAEKHGVDPAGLRAWLEFLGVTAGGPTKIEGLFTKKRTSSDYDFIHVWGENDTPVFIANSSDQHVRIPGNMPPHSVAVHPTPTLRTAAGWRSPVTAAMRVEGAVTHAHPECGNGVTWSLELRRGATRQRLAAGVSQGGGEVKVGPIENLAVREGDVVSLLIGPRDGNHSCDLTTIELRLASGGEKPQTWSLTDDVSGNLLAGNPHDDRLGNKGVWHFYTEPEKGGSETAIPAGSLLAKWQTAAGADEKRALADSLQQLLLAGPPSAQDSPDAELFQQLAMLAGPLFRMSPDPGGERQDVRSARDDSPSSTLGPADFGKHPRGGAVSDTDLCVQAPAVIEVRLPAALVAGYELVTTVALHPATGSQGSVQVAIVAGKADAAESRPSPVANPILANETGDTRKRIEAGFDEFRRLFPPVLCYTKIVPVDEVITLNLFYREDEHLVRLMLDDEQAAQLDRLWSELRYISRDALKMIDVYEQLLEYASQDRPDIVIALKPMRGRFDEQAEVFRRAFDQSEPKHLDALVRFAERAYRRPLQPGEAEALRDLYRQIRAEGLDHEEAFRMTLTRVLVAPAFLYRVETPGPGEKAAPLDDWELASRLSYFLWSSLPDEALREAAASGRLSDPEVLVAQTQRMLRGAKTRRLATEFACQWLHIYDFDQLDEKSETVFPTFAEMRGPMYEESIQFFTDLFQNDGSVLNILDAEYTFLNEQLAKHYAIPGVSGERWRRVEGVKQHARGGILAQASILSQQSGASRTSPILRGNWISEVLLGERLPRPPKDVPPLPDEDPASVELTVRQLVQRHTSDRKCAVCHERIDPLGFSLEGFDAIGRRQEKDAAGRPIDTNAKTIDGAEFVGVEGLRNYLLGQRREAFVRQFCRKLLGYALGRAVQLSDEALLTQMQADLAANDYRVGRAIETIVRSKQFREIRGRETLE